MKFDTLEKKIGDKSAAVAFVGLGKMGLPTALLIADAGFRVTGIDVNEKVVEACNECKSPYLEPGLDDYLEKNKSRFKATLDYSAVKEADVVLCAVPTIIDSKRHTDFSIVEKAFSQIGMHLKRGSLVVFESNVTPGITETLVKSSLEKQSGMKCGVDFLLAYVPIQGKAGQMFDDLKKYERVVSGMDAQARGAADLLFRKIGNKTILASSIKVVELEKLFANIYKDINIAIANELDAYCRMEGIESNEVIAHVNKIPGINLFLPDIGVGGNCLPVDPYFYVDDAKSKGMEIRLAALARKINDERPALFARKIIALAKKKGTDKVCLLGMAFRPNTHETAYSPAIEVYKLVKKELPKTAAFDPLVGAERMRALGIDAVSEPQLADYKLKVRLARHDAFKGLDCVDALGL